MDLELPQLVKSSKRKASIKGDTLAKDNPATGQLTLTLTKTQLSGHVSTSTIIANTFLNESGLSELTDFSPDCCENDTS